MQIDRAHEMMMSWGVVLGEVMDKVFTPLAPEYDELRLAYSGLDPMISHIDSLGSALLASAIGEAFGEGIVDGDWGGWMGMPRVLKDFGDGKDITHVTVAFTDLGFGVGSHGILEDVAGGVDGVIVERQGRVGYLKQRGGRESS